MTVDEILKEVEGIEGGYWIAFGRGNDSVDIDGRFTPAELRRIADLFEEYQRITK